MLAILLALLLGGGPVVTTEGLPEAVELSCTPTGEGRLEGCQIVADRCKGAGYARRALQLARKAKVDPTQIPGAEPVQVLIPCAQIAPPGLQPPPGPRTPGGDAARERQRCRRPGGVGPGMPC